MFSKDLVTNASTGLMAIKDLSSAYEVPINIHFEDGWIHINIGFGTHFQTTRRYYTQDMYKTFEETDEIYDDIEKVAEEVGKLLKGE